MEGQATQMMTTRSVEKASYGQNVRTKIRARKYDRIRAAKQANRHADRQNKFACLDRQTNRQTRWGNGGTVDTNDD